MPKLSREEVEAFLAERGHLARIATVKPDGAPSVVPVWFLHERGKIHITPRKHSEFGHNLRRDPRAAITIDEEAGLEHSRYKRPKATERTTSDAGDSLFPLPDARFTDPRPPSDRGRPSPR
jgi:nitroimidazol reductase NimA-like FMN-containing flavoprotein (pyridoxamine 5'-phosphate oxidase superfamily)